MSLHDVTPAFEPDIRAQIDTLLASGITQFVLKAVPSWHGAYRLSENPAFVSFLASHVLAGAEICLHGKEHRVRGPLAYGSTMARARARLFAPQAAEFISIPPDEAADSIAEGLAEIERASLPAPVSFCAPAWLMPEDCKPLLRSAGLSVYVGMYSLEILDGSITYRVPGFGYMGGSEVHEVGIRLLNRLMSPITGRAQLVKVYLHPDTSGRRRWRSTIETVRTMIEKNGLIPETYAGLLRERSTAVFQES